MDTMTFDATMHHGVPTGRPTPDDPATIRDLIHLMADEDASRLVGDILRRSAILEWKHYVSPHPFKSRGQLVREWYEHARDEDHDFILEFPVALVGRSLVPTQLTGGMTIKFAARKDRIPQYVRVDVGT